jgi:hypothetical protein
MLTGYKASIENDDLILSGSYSWKIEFVLAAFCALFGMFLLAFIVIESNLFMSEPGAMIFLILLALVLALGCAKSMHSIAYKKPKEIYMKISPENAKVSIEYRFPLSTSQTHDSSIPLPWKLHYKWESNNDAADNLYLWITYSDNQTFYIIDRVIVQTTSGSKALFKTITEWIENSGYKYSLSLSESGEKIV